MIRYSMPLVTTKAKHLPVLKQIKVHHLVTMEELKGVVLVLDAEVPSQAAAINGKRHVMLTVGVLHVKVPVTAVEYKNLPGPKRLLTSRIIPFAKCHSL